MNTGGIWLTRPWAFSPRARKLVAFLYETIEPSAVVLVAALSQGEAMGPMPARGTFSELLAAAAEDTPAGGDAARALFERFVRHGRWSPRTHYTIACHLAPHADAAVRGALERERQEERRLVRRIGRSLSRRTPTGALVAAFRVALYVARRRELEDVVLRARGERAEVFDQLRRAFDPRRVAPAELYALADWAWSDPSLATVRDDPSFSALTAPFRGAIEVDTLLNRMQEEQSPPTVETA